MTCGWCRGGGWWLQQVETARVELGRSQAALASGLEHCKASVSIKLSEDTSSM